MFMKCLIFALGSALGHRANIDMILCIVFVLVLFVMVFIAISSLKEAYQNRVFKKKFDAKI